MEPVSAFPWSALKSNHLARRGSGAPSCSVRLAMQSLNLAGRVHYALFLRAWPAGAILASQIRWYSLPVAALPEIYDV